LSQRKADERRGAGRDVFVFDAKPNKRTNLDAITDFKAPDDTIWLQKAVFSKVGKKGALKKAQFHAGAKATDDDHRIVYNNKTGALYYDADGEGGRAQVQFAKLLDKAALTHRDFFLF
jgi:Ca2+-binding RTX toxin-like protein